MTDPRRTPPTVHPSPPAPEAPRGVSSAEPEASPLYQLAAFALWVGFFLLACVGWLTPEM